jgi:hypothetical protein
LSAEALAKADLLLARKRHKDDVRLVAPRLIDRSNKA